VSFTADEITKRLRAWRFGDRSALDSVLPAVLANLRLIARRIPRQGSTLNATALVNEAWLRISAADSEFTDREHFFALAARSMRQVLIDHARTCHRHKRGGGAPKVTLTDDSGLTDTQIEQLLIIDDLLDRLEKEQPRRCRIFEMRFFAGFSVDELAEDLKVSNNTIIREYRLACAWLRFHFDSSVLGGGTGA
jgi:RNA polymerase sigma factor (TIGR02999 family)